MNLTEYVRIFVRRGWIILLAAVLTAGSGYIFSKLQTPVFRSTQKILVKPARIDFGLTQSLKQVMDSWATRIDTELRAKEVIDALKLDMTPGALHELVHITPDLNNLQLNVDVDSTRPDQANRIASEYGSQFIQWRNQENQPTRLEDRINAELLDAPQASLLRPNTKINVIAGALLGVLVGGVIIFALEFLDSNIVRSAKDVERYLQLSVLGNLPDTQ
ncbi:MAG: Wzz/FepE/Etk N-terminal domain-containing protein [Chloroflexota bacterium]